MANTSTTNDSILLSQIVNQGVNIYGSREKIREALVEYAKNYLNLGDVDINKTSYLAYLIDMLSILSANHIFYDSTIYREFFFTDAQMTESVNNLAKWIGYSIPKAVPAEVDLMFSIPLNFGSDTINFTFSPYFYTRSGDIPYIIKSTALDISSSASVNLLSKNQLSTKDWVVKGSIVNNSAMNVRDNEGYYKPVYLSKNADTAFFMLPFIQKEVQLKVFQIPTDLAVNQFYSIPVTFEGQVCDIEVFVVSPSPNQKLSIADSSIDNVLDAANFDPINDEFVDSSGNSCKWVKWTESANGIYTMSARSTQYSWIGGYNKGEILFGNGILGKQPPAGSIIAVRLHVTQGSRGNVIANTITSGDSIFTSTKSQSVTSINYTVRNTHSAHGGEDLLTLPEIKQNAITNLSAKKRLVSEWDYDNIKTILGNSVPLSDSYSILKRSDIKINEIDVFTTLNYITDEVNEIVPTRNVSIELENPKWDENGKYTLYRDYQIEYPPRSGDKYLTMFNLTCDKDTMTASYDYILQNVYGSATRMYSKSQNDNYWDRFIYITGNGANFGIDINKKALLGNNYPLNVRFNVNHVASKIRSDWVDKIKEGTACTLTAKDLSNEATGGQTEWYNGDYTTLLSITKFRASMITKWGKFDVYQPTASHGYSANTITEDTDDKKYVKTTYQNFNWRIDNYLTVPEGTQRFEFLIEALVPKRLSDGSIVDINGAIVIDKNGALVSKTETPIQFVWTAVNTYYCDIVIRRNLDNFMSSSLTNNQSLIDSGKETTPKYIIHNVPVILNDYYHNIINNDDNNIEVNNFELNVMQKLVSNLNLSDSRMLTDFVNIKFADTYGSLINLRYNKVDYMIESRYWHTPWWKGSGQVQDKTDMNPDYEAAYSKKESDRTEKADAFPDIMTSEYFIDPAANVVYYIVNGVIPEEKRPLSEYIGHIALRVPHRIAEGQYEWTYNLYEPQIGTYVRVKDEIDNEGYNKTLVWTGKEWKDVLDYNIPLTISLKVEVDDTLVSMTDEAIKETIIDTLTQYYANNKMGLQRNLDRSEIIRVCRSVPGVVYAELTDPAVDIRFNYTMKDLTQQQLLDFTPEYIGFRGKSANEDSYGRSTVNISIVRR